MNYLEAKPQCWRAVAVFDDRSERLIYLGRSSPQVRAGFVDAFMQLLDDEERERVTAIQLQRWNGAPDAGRWVVHGPLNIPATAKLARSA